MRSVQFRIGDAFPADDAVARFITVVAMMSNDALRSLGDMLALDDRDDDVEARRVMLFRQQAALHHEAARCITQAQSRFDEIRIFVEGLSRDARADCAHVVGGGDAKSEYYLGDWLADHRNVTFHYPELHPAKAAHDREEVMLALRKAADMEATIATTGQFGSVRFRFADDVAVQWLPDTETQVHLVEALRDSVLALTRFAQYAATAYLRTRPQGTFSVVA